VSGAKSWRRVPEGIDFEMSTARGSPTSWRTRLKGSANSLARGAVETFRVCKCVARCLLKLFNETDLADGIREEYVEQVACELLTHVTSGINETALMRLLNAVAVKPLDADATHAPKGLLVVIGESSNCTRFGEERPRGESIPAASTYTGSESLAKA